MSVDASSHNHTNMNFIFSQFIAAKNPVRPRKNTAEGGWGEFRRVLAKNRGQARRPAHSEQNPAKKFSFPCKLPCASAGRFSNRARGYRLNNLS